MTNNDALGDRLLEEMRKEGVGLLRPDVDAASVTGYAYPRVAKWLGLKDGSEAVVLDALVEMGRLGREVSARYCHCPHCGDYKVKIGGDCGPCKGAHLKRVVMIHHYRCACVATEAEFLQGRDYICPKCRRMLEHVGVDYDRPGHFYLCDVCLKRFPEDGLTSRCSGCGNAFPADSLPEKMAFSYTLPLEEKDRG